MHVSERELELPKLEIGKLLELAAEKPEVLNLGPGEPDFPLPKKLVQALAKLSKEKTINRYAPPSGFLELRKAISEKLKKENKIRHAEPERIVVTAGSQEAILLASAATLCAAEGVLLPNPSFMGYFPTIELLDALPIFFPVKEENGFEPRVEEIEKAILPKKTKAIILNSPANPTGNVIKKSTWEEIADIAVEHDLYIFSDEAYEKFVYDDAKHFSPASLNGMEEYVFTFQSFSKTFAMCGFRLGYALAPSVELAEAMSKEHIFSTICAPRISQLLALEALKLGSNWINATIKEYDKRRRFILKRLNEIGLSTPEPKGAFYAFSNIKKFETNSKKFAYELLKKAKVAVIPGVDFGTGGEGYIRLSYATSMQIIEKAMDKIEVFLKRY